MLWREARARALAGLGDLGEGERSAREAVAIGRGTEPGSSVVDDDAVLADALRGLVFRGA